MNQNKGKYLNKKDVALIEYLINQKRYKDLYDFLRKNRFIRYITKFQEYAYKLMLIMKDDPADENSLYCIGQEIKTVINYIKKKQLNYNAGCSLRYYRRKKRKANE